MIKHTSILIAVAIFSTTYVIGMEITTTPNYTSFFDACKNNDTQKIHRFMTHKDNKTFDINHQNEHGETALLYASSWGAWQVADILLKEYNTDKSIKDNYGQSVFSKSFYTSMQNRFENILQQYSAEEINAECKTLVLYRNPQYQVFPEVHCLITDMLEGKKIGAVNGPEIVFMLACTHNYFPYIVQLLQQNKWLAYCEHTFRKLSGGMGLALLEDKTHFTLREFFNDGSYVPFQRAALLTNVFTLFKDELNSDVTTVIVRYFLELHQLTPDELFSTLEAMLWKIVCVSAYNLGKNKDEQETNEQRCLLRILALSQSEKTTLNIKLLKSQKK